MMEDEVDNLGRDDRDPAYMHTELHTQVHALDSHACMLFSKRMQRNKDQKDTSQL